MKNVFRYFTILLTILLFISAAACRPPQKSDYDELTITVPKDYPVEIFGVTIEKCPQKVVSLSPLVTDVILSLGSDSQLAGISEDSPADTLSKLPRLGTMYKPDIDKIISLGADVVITALPFSDEDQVKMQEQDIPVVILNSAANWDGLSALYESAGVIMGGNAAGAENAKNTIKRINQSIDSIKKKVEKETAPKALLILSFGEVAAPVKSIEGYLLQAAGGANAARQDAQFRFEKKDIQDSQAEYIFCSKQDAEKILADKDLSDLTAVKEKKVVAVDIGLLSRQGDGMIDIAEQMAKIMHPDVFTEPSASAATETEKTTTAAQTTTVKKD